MTDRFDPDDEFWTGCDESCDPDCMADHQGEE